MSDPEIISDGAQSQTWDEGAGEPPSSELADRLGVTRHVTETYSVGGYRYTSLVDAISQARRMTKLERELLK